MAAENKNINMTSYHHLKLRPVIWSEIWRLTWVKKYSGKWHCAGGNINRCPEILITPEIEQKMLQHTPIRRLGNRKILLTQLCSFARLQPAG